MATAAWVFANRCLMSNGGQMHELRRGVDWHYSFDIHCNGFFPYFIWTRVIQFILLPLLLRPSFLACLVSNCLYMIGCVLYAYIVFLGYLELPMLVQQQQLVYPVPAIFIYVLHHYFWQVEPDSMDSVSDVANLVFPHPFFYVCSVLYLHMDLFYCIGAILRSMNETEKKKARLFFVSQSIYIYRKRMFVCACGS
ncbi:hypothetical protein C4B63_2g151 [Trypanosoma cruzi]|uniref:Uncharacterized protein n=1 Tax=Trypanosoma cruzi TaxID=5693 RepID=A0A2V2W7E4_TRYCR|nr:hypothetical protein C4B63_2g151 [Trypanosoma cruzi]